MDERAESAVVGEVLLVVGVIVGAGLLFLMGAGSEPEAPPAIGMNDDGAQVSGTKSFTLAATGLGIDWGSIAVLLDGSQLTYSTLLATDGNYCISLASGACAANDPTRDLAAGQQLKVHHTALPGKTLQLVHREGNAMLYAKVLGG